MKFGATNKQNLILCKFCMKQFHILVQSPRSFCSGPRIATFGPELIFRTLFSHAFSLWCISQIRFKNIRWWPEVTSVGADQNDCGLWRRDLTLRSLTNDFMPHNETVHESGVLSDIFTLQSDVKLIKLARRQKGFSKLKMFATSSS